MASRVLRPFTDNRPGVTFCDLHFGHSFILVMRGLTTELSHAGPGRRNGTEGANRRWETLPADHTDHTEKICVIRVICGRTLPQKQRHAEAT
jgi:hypothetical protein